MSAFIVSSLGEEFDDDGDEGVVGVVVVAVRDALDARVSVAAARNASCAVAAPLVLRPPSCHHLERSQPGRAHLHERLSGGA